MTARWSKTPPTVPGWYWERFENKEPEILHFVFDGEDIGYWSTDSYGDSEFTPLRDYACASWAWCGPIEPPREGGGACERMPPCACCGCQFSAHVIEGRIGECVALRLRSDVDSEDVCECDMYIIPDPELP